MRFHSFPKQSERDPHCDPEIAASPRLNDGNFDAANDGDPIFEPIPILSRAIASRCENALPSNERTDREPKPRPLRAQRPDRGRANAPTKPIMKPTQSLALRAEAIPAYDDSEFHAVARIAGHRSGASHRAKALEQRWEILMCQCVSIARRCADASLHFLQRQGGKQSDDAGRSPER